MRPHSYSPLAVPAAVLVLALAAAACQESAEGAASRAEPPVPVRLAPVERAASAAITATGALGNKDEVPLAFKIGGVVARVAVDEGARVRRGQVLAELDLREIDAAVSKATAAAEKARRDAARAERLYTDSVASLAQRQDAQTARDAAEADLRVARVNREYAVIVAASDGVILRRLVHPGAQVASGAPVLMLGSAERGSVVRVGLPDRDVIRVRVGDSAVVRFDAIPGRDFRGAVRQVAAAADPRTGTYSVEVTLPAAASLPSGLVGRVSIAAGAGAAGQDGDDVQQIPADALVEGDRDRGVVFAVDETQGLALRREVNLVGVRGDRVLVRGLESVTHVVTTGAAWLRDSVRVEVKP